ncbi:MAG: metallophosphoesterase [Gammaproteobacteria bacterium]|nr:metallophosphoesterase [Gammaproteobacteria bacterium]
MSLLIQISDTHFGTEQAAVVAALYRLTQALKPDVAILSGDITQRARSRQFAAARRFLDELHVPKVMSIPGNHDIPLLDVFARMLYPYRNYMRAFGAELEPQLDCEAFRIVALNTTRPTRHKNGEVSPHQIERVTEQLRAARPTQLRIVVTHQPVQVMHPQDVENLLIGHEAAARAWVGAGADLMMGGHIHLPYVLPLKRMFPGLSRSAWVVQAGTAISSRTRAGIPNSVNVVHHECGAISCGIERWDFQATAGAFTCVAREQLVLDR